MSSDLLPALTREKRELLAWGDPQYDELLIFHGDSWKLYLNEDQRYLGRAYFWYIGNHIDFHQFDDLLCSDAHIELGTLLRIYRSALTYLWNPVTLNCAWLGNEYSLHRGHGHLHVVPRYAEAPRVGDQFFPDELFGKDYKPYEKLKLSREKLLELVGTIKDAFEDYLS